MSTADDRTAGIFWRQWGESGPPVLLLHPVGFDHHSFDLLARRLHGFRLFGLDLPGHGSSERPEERCYTLPALAERVMRWMDAHGMESAAVVGNSLGGGVALAMAIRWPHRVWAMGLLGTVGLRSGMSGIGRLAFLPGLRHLARLSTPFIVRTALRMPRYHLVPPAPQIVQRSVQYLQDPRGAAAFLETVRALYGAELHDMAGHYAAIRTPTLIIHGQQDPLISLKHAYNLATAIPSAELQVLPHCGHFLQEECPEATARLLLPFLQHHAPHAAVPARE